MSSAEATPDNPVKTGEKTATGADKESFGQYGSDAQSAAGKKGGAISGDLKLTQMKLDLTKLHLTANYRQRVESSCKELVWFDFA